MATTRKINNNETSKTAGLVFLGGIIMKNKIINIAGTIIVALALVLVCTSCRQADRVSENLSKEADNFNIVRQVTVMNCIKGDVLFQMTGKMSIKADTTDNQLEIIVEDGGRYTKHFIGLSDNVTYVVEDLNLGENEVSNYHYTLNYNPEMWLPVDVKTID